MGVEAARRRDDSAAGEASPVPAEPDPFPGAVGTSGLDLASALGWVLAFVGFLIGARAISDNSFLTHLATGRLILETGSVPRLDPYSAIATGEPWTVQSWLVSLVYASLDSALGPWAIRVMNGLLGAAIVRGVWRLTERARQLLARVGLTSVVLVIGTFLWPPRPLLVGLLAMVVLLQVAQGQRSRWLLVPLFWIWVNSHGSYVLGAVALGLLTVGAAIDDRRVPLSELRLVLCGAIGCLLSMINPLGWSLLWFPVQLMTRREALDRVAEWSSPSFRSPVEQLFLLLLFVVVIGAGRRAPWRALLPSLVFFIAGLVAVRNLGPASIVIVAMMAPSLSGLAGTVDGAVSGIVPRTVALVAAAGFAFAALLIRHDPAIELDDYPVAQVDWLEARELVATPGVRLAQRDHVGNYLSYRYGSEARVFMDDRFDFYPLTVVEDHIALIVGDDLREVVERNGFDVILWQRDSALGRWVGDQPDWETFVEDDDWFVACRTTSEYADRCRS